MWTQVSNGSYKTLTAASSVGATSVTLSNTTNVKIGNWLIIQPFNASCEIREITGITGTVVNISTALQLQFSHASGVKVYIATSPIWDMRLFFDPANIDPSAANRDAIYYAAKDCSFNGGGVVWIPKGTHSVKKTTGLNTCINLDGFANISFIGEGMSVSIIQLASNYGSGNISLFSAKNAANISWVNMTMDGNYNSIISPPSQIIAIESSDFSNTANNIFIDRLEFYNTTQSLLFSNVSILTIENSWFTESRKNAIVIQNKCLNLSILGSYFNGAEQEDILIIASGSSTVPINYIISGNIFERKNNFYTALSIKNREFTFDQSYIISENIFQSCSVFFSCSNLNFSNNIIAYNPNAANGEVPISCFGDMKNVLIKDNIISNYSATIFDYPLAIHCYPDSTPGYEHSIQNISIVGNTIRFGKCYIEESKNISVSNNNFETKINDNAAIEIFIKNNSILYDFGTSYGYVKILNNQIRQVGKTGIRIESQDIDNAVFKLILVDNNTILGYDDLPPIAILVVGNNPGTFWYRALIGDANLTNADFNAIVSGNYLLEQNPNQEVWVTNKRLNMLYLAAPPGALAIDRSQEADNEWVNNDITNNLEWELVTEVGKQMVVEDYFENMAAPSTIDLDNPSLHKIKFYVFSATNFWQLIIGYWGIDGDNEVYAVYSSAKALAVIQTISDGEVKGVFKEPDLPSEASTATGIVFRYADQDNYWYLIHSGENDVKLGYLSASVDNVIYSSSSCPLGNSRKFVLKVMFKGNYISAFYNELLLVNILDSTFINQASVGLLFEGTTDTSEQRCLSFKHLIP